MRTTGAAIGAAAIGAVGLAPAFADTPVDAIDSALTKVTILNINDFHGRIGGDLGLNFACNVVTHQQAAGAGNYLFLSAGDNIGATPFVSSSQDDTPTIEFLNALELDASAVGNHEFDRGFSDLTGRVNSLADFSYLGANVYERGTTTPALPESVTFDVNGVSVAVIGAVTQETPSLVSPDGVQMLDFGNPVQAVNRVAADLAGTVDIIIAQYHEGATNGGSSIEAEVAAGGAFADIVTNTSEDVDAIFTAHTHQEYVWQDATADGVRPVIQSGSYGSPLGVVEFGVDPATGALKEFTAENVATSDDDYAGACDGNARFAAAAAIAADAEAEAEVVGAQVIGEITADITTAFTDDGARDDRLRESTLGNLTAEAWLWGMNVPGRPGADIGIMNPGGLRAELFYDPTDAEAPGEVTFKEAAEVHPFANTMQVIDITGAQFKTLLEQQWQPEDSSRPFLKLGLSENVRYTYNPAASKGERVTGVWFEGEPMDMAATYTIASGSFLIGGGDNFTVLQEGKNRRDSGLIDTDVFVNYMAQQDAVAPNFEKNGVAVEGATLPIKANASGKVSFTVSGIDLTSLGSPDNTAFTIYLGDVKVGTAAIRSDRVDSDLFPTRDGVSDVTFTVPANSAGGPTVITLVAEPSGTTVKLQATIAAKGPVIETDIPAGNGSGALGLLAGALVLAAAGAVAVTRRRSAQH